MRRIRGRSWTVVESETKSSATRARPEGSHVEAHQRTSVLCWTGVCYTASTVQHRQYKQTCAPAAAGRLIQDSSCISSAYLCGWRSWLFISRAKSTVYSRKRIGPRTDPCGTPHVWALGQWSQQHFGWRYLLNTAVDRVSMFCDCLSSCYKVEHSLLWALV